MIPREPNKKNEQWDAFEYAASYSYARSVVQKTRNRGAYATVEVKAKRMMSAIKYSSFLVNSNNPCLGACLRSSNVGRTTNEQQGKSDAVNEELFASFQSALNDTQKGMEQVRNFQR